MDQSAFTFEQWSAALADVAIRLEHQGFKVDQRPVGPSIEYRFVHRGTDCGTWQITPSATGAAFTFYPPTIEIPASGVYDDPEVDKAIWQCKEYIEQAIIARARELREEKGAVQEPPQPQPSAGSETTQEPPAQTDPLAVIENPAHRDWVRLWNKGYSETEIGERCGHSPGTVGNVMYLLRKQHGAKVVIWHT